MFGCENWRMWKNVLFNLICKYLRAWVTKKKYEAKESVRECQEGEKASLAHVELRKFVQPCSDDVVLQGIALVAYISLQSVETSAIPFGRGDKTLITFLAFCVCDEWIFQANWLMDFDSSYSCPARFVFCTLAQSQPINSAFLCYIENTFFLLLQRLD